MPQTLRAEFSKTAAPLPEDRVLSRLQTHHLSGLPAPRQSGTGRELMRIRRLPTWPECFLIVLAVSSATAGLNHYMLLRSASFLDEQITQALNALGAPPESYP